VFTLFICFALKNKPEKAGQADAERLK